MLTSNELVELYRTHRDQPVLSVYLDADQHDFAERSKWRITLKNGLAEERAKADEPELFDRAFEKLEESFEAAGRGFLSGRGWVGFATPEQRLYAEGLPVPMPNLVRWEQGLRVAPYARALKQSRPVVAVIADSRRARILRYRMGTLAERSRLQADTYLGDLTDVNVAKRASDHSGVRGKTGTDAAQRFLEVERDRLLGRVTAAVELDAGADGFVVLGGAERTTDALRKELEISENRLATASGLSFDSSDAEIRDAVEAAASDLSAREHTEVVGGLIEQARANGDACLGANDTERALAEQRVRTLVVADTLREDEPDRIDHLEGAAFEQGADVVEVSGEARDQLVSGGEGVGALLRYRIRT